jgi:hypothetical protein
MARALQDLRAKFTYHSVAALTRRHCVIPIVDGFDELIGPSSAREAFANLSQFLGQLECEGALVASSRSGFIDYRTLYDRAAELAASQRLSYEIIPLEVMPWDDRAITRYCHERTPESGDLERKVFSLMASPAGDLVRKPFFLTKICDVFEEGGDIDVQRDITHQLVDVALTREASKLRDERGRELLSAEQHRTFCELLAEEMWSLGNPELDCETIRLLAEMMAEQSSLSPRDTKTLVDRSVAHGLLTVVHGRIPEKRAFEHELFRFEFQAGGLARALRAGFDASRDYVQRAELPLEIVSRVPFYGLADGGMVGNVIATLNRIVAAAPNNQFSPTNGGSIVAALIRDRDDLPVELKLHGFYLRSQSLGRCRLLKADIRRCFLEHVDLSSAELRDCGVPETQFVACIVGAKTRWDNTELDVNQFSGIIFSAHRRREIYDPKEIRRLLTAGGAVIAAEAQEVKPIDTVVGARVNTVEHLFTHARTHFYISRQENWFQHNLNNDPQWATVERMLRAHKLLEDVRLTKSGRPETFLRLTIAPDKILQARAAKDKDTPPAAVRFWGELLQPVVVSPSC